MRVTVTVQAGAVLCAWRIRSRFQGLRAAPLQVRVTGGLRGWPVPPALPPALLPVALSDIPMLTFHQGKDFKPIKALKNFSGIVELSGEKHDRAPTVCIKNEFFKNVEVILIIITPLIYIWLYHL